MNNSWHKIKFPDNLNIVYVIYVKKGNIEKPIYVGESNRHIGRFGDYIAPSFWAPTAFKVGVALRYLKERGFDVIFKYKNSNNRQIEEKKLKANLKTKFILLNEVLGYHRKKSDKNKVRKKIKYFVDKEILSQWTAKR